MHAETAPLLRFFPRDRVFWLYHGAATTLGMLITIGLALLWNGTAMGYRSACSVLWIPLYTVTVLAFRWAYQRHDGQAAPMGKLIAAVFIFGAIAGVLIAVVVVGTVTPFYWAGFVEKYKAHGMVAIPAEFFAQNLMEMGPQNQLFISVWCFIYISVTGSRRMRQAELFNLRLQNNLKEAQLSSLSNQLNPHFLFNSLNNIRFMIHEDARHADAMITAFSDILRYSLESSKQEKVSLGHEAAIIDKYIDIVKSQFEERLRFTMQIDPALHGLLVPPMVLHMLVENAIKHGLDHLREGGRLDVSAALEHDALVVRVRNDIPAQAGACGTGIGLRNIGRRLQLLYGTRARLDARRDGSEFCAVLTLPRERAA